jgi:hypothetical protein
MNTINYTANDHNGTTFCSCGCKYWDQWTSQIATSNYEMRSDLHVTCASCGKDLNETLPGIKTGTVYYENLTTTPDPVA